MSVGDAPPKFVKDSNGVRRLNPAYKQWQAAQQQQQSAAGGAGGAQNNTQFHAAPQMLNADTALPVVSSIEEQQRHLQGTKTSDAVTASVEILQDDDIAAEIGMTGANVMKNLTRIFSKFEVPMGLLNKLMALSDFTAMEFLVDDSGSMNQTTDSKDPSGRWMTRWQEVHQRIVQMFEVLAYVPKPPISIRFLNRGTVINLHHQPGMAPEQFLQMSLQAIAQCWQQMPAGTTPARERIGESLRRYQGQSCIRYFFGDGQPNGGNMACRDITQMLIHRPSPAQNPFTFMSCTDDDAQVEWMKEAEEAAPFCAELDDFMDESREVLGDQGKAFPFSFGLYLVCSLVAAFNPDDLDALDESVPFTKNTLDNLSGWQMSEQEYFYYFDSFIEAQVAKPVETVLDKLKRDYINVWKANFQHFVAAPMSKQIPVVQQYQQQLLELKNRGA